MDSHLKIRAVRYAAYVLAALVLIVIAAALLVPFFLDTPAVERELQAKLSQLVQGEVAWEKLSIRLLPSPRGSLRMVRVEIPGVAEVRAEEVDAHLQLLPLLRGRAEVASVTLSKPAIRVQIAPSPPAREAPTKEAPADPLGVYRSVVDGIRRFAPEAEVAVEGGELDLALAGMPAVRVRALELHGRTDSDGASIEVKASSEAWSRLKLEASVVFADYSGTGKLQLAGLKAQPWLDRFLEKSPVRVAVPEAGLSLEARSDGKSRIEAAFDMRAGAGTDGQVEIAASGMPAIRARDVEVHGRTDNNGASIELTAAGDAWSRLKVGASVVFADYSGKGKLELVGLKAQPWLDRLLEKSPVRVAVPETGLSLEARSDGKSRIETAFDLRAGTVDILRTTERVAVPGVVITGTATATGEELALRLTSAQLGGSRLARGSLRYGLKSHSLTTVADFDLDVAQAVDATRRLLPEDAGKGLARFKPVSGRAQGQAKFDLRRSAWNAVVDLRKSDSAIGIEGLPGPVKVAAASVNVTADATRIDGADVAMLDGRALASSTISYGKRLRIEGAVSQGTVGGELLAWLWKTAGIPPHLKLKSPVAIAVQRATWAPKQPLHLAATASFDSGPSVAVDLGWTPQVLDIRRAAIKDAKSDAAVAFHLEKNLLHGRFTGSLQSASLGAMLKTAKVPQGGASGDLRFRFDLKHPERFSATGKLQGASVDLTWLLARPVVVERFDVQADGQKLGIRQASVNWADQRFALSGEVARAADGAPIIDARIESPGVVVDALVETAAAAEPSGPEKAKEAKSDEPLWTLWPLPVRGHIVFQSTFVQYGERRAEPVTATLTLEEQRAFLELQQVKLCGISFPLTVEGRREGLVIAVRLVAQKQQLQQTARCLSERGVQIDGDFDLSADLRTQGRVPELLSNLEGTVEAEAREGKVIKFAMLGNILTTQAVAGMFNQDGPKVDEKGFPYRRITAKGRFEKGAFVIDESFFRSDIIGIAANGSISLIDDETRPYDSRLTVLVAPLGKLDRMVRSVPVLGYLLGGVLTSVPVAVSGDIRNPRVVPLGPGAVVSELAGVFERALKLPGRVLSKPAQSPSP